MGSVDAIWRYPVKSMLGEQLPAAQFAVEGVVGDRAYALIDDETGNVVSVKRPKRWGRMFELTAVSGPSGVSVVFPDETIVGIDDVDLAPRLSEFFGRSVSIGTSPAPDARFDEVWVRELKDGVNPYFDAPTRVEDGDEMIYGATRMGEGASFNNFGAVHIVTTSTSRELTERAPDTRFDPHRFRPNQWNRLRRSRSPRRSDNFGRGTCAASRIFPAISNRR